MAFVISSCDGSSPVVSCLGYPGSRRSSSSVHLTLLKRFWCHFAVYLCWHNLFVLAWGWSVYFLVIKGHNGSFESTGVWDCGFMHWNVYFCFLFFSQKCPSFGVDRQRYVLSLSKDLTISASASSRSTGEGTDDAQYSIYLSVILSCLSPGSSWNVLITRNAFLNMERMMFPSENDLLRAQSPIWVRWIISAFMMLEVLRQTSRQKTMTLTTGEGDTKAAHSCI